MVNARKHKTPTGSDTTVNRATIFETFGNSIRDVVPVANTIERSQVVAALTAAGEEPSPERPLLVYRADAAGMGRLEISAGGDVWSPASGRLRFGSAAEADSWALSNGSLLSAGDVALINGLATDWLGTRWGHVQSSDVTLGSGWSPSGGGQHNPRIYRQGRMNFLVGSITSGPGFSYSSMMTVAAPFRPVNPSTRLVGSGVTSNGIAFELAMTNGVISLPVGYAAASIPQGQAHPLHLFWLND